MLLAPSRDRIRLLRIRFKTVSDSLFSSLRTAESSVRRWISALPTTTFAILLLSLMLIKTGLNFTPQPEGGVERDTWPAPSGHIGGSSYGFRAIIIYLDLEGFRQLATLGLVLTAVFVGLVIATFRRIFNGDVQKLGLLLVLSSPLVIVSFLNIGRYDIFVFIGAWLIAISQTKQIPTSIAAIGIILMIAGNPEHTAVAAAILLFMSSHPLLRPFRRQALAAFLAATIAVIVTSLWSASIGKDSRFTYWPDYVEASWATFSKALPLVLYSGYGILWGVVLLTLLITTRVQRVWLMIGFIAAPVFATATSLDQTRVFVGVTALPILALTLAWLMELQEASLPRHQVQRALLLGCVISLLLPSIEYTQNQVVRNPYEWFVYLQSVGLQFF